MRIDKYLKISRLIKRRSVANDACSSGRILINNKEAKPSADVKIGDIIEMKMGQKELKIEVTKLVEYIVKDEAETLYKIL